MTKQRLPDRRASETFEITAGGMKYRATASRFADGWIALQHGVPLDVIRRALMRDGRGRPNGPLGVALDLLAGEGA